MNKNTEIAYAARCEKQCSNICLKLPKIIKKSNHSEVQWSHPARDRLHQAPQETRETVSPQGRQSKLSQSHIVAHIWKGNSWFLKVGKLPDNDPNIF